MSYLNINSDLFVGSHELNRLIKFLDEDGFRKIFLKNSISFGIFDNSIYGEFDNGQISQGTNIGTIKHNELYAINDEGNIIYKTATDNIGIVNDNLWRWLKVSHSFSPVESYLVSVDKSGNLSAPGGNLTEILRGNPNNPSRISFPNATLNVYTYDVLEVIDDENAVLSGDFLAETELQLAVVGSFTPGVTIPTGSKYPFQYDSCILTAVLEESLNTPPSLIDGNEFLLARVKRNGSTITIQDKRGLNIYQDKADYKLNEISISDNALIGVESVRFDSINTPRDKNLVQVAWVFRSSNWTIDSSINRVTLIAGQGGKFKTTSDFTDGDFDGWRLYTEDGTYHIIKQSSLSATQINLIIDTLDVDKFTNTTQQLIVAPNAESIKLIFTGDSADSDGIDLGNEIFEFPINQEFAVIPLTVFEDPSYYNVKYAYINFRSYSAETAIPSDLISGYLTEASFDDNGNQISNTRQTYESDDELGFIVLNLAANAYRNVIDGLTLGDLPGLEYVALNTDVDPVIVFKVGVRKQNVIITNDNDIELDDSDLGSYTLTDDAYIDFRTDSPANIRNGNSFFFQLRGEYILSGNTFQIVQNFVNSGNPGSLIYEFTQDDLDQAAVDNLFFRATFDGTNWILNKIISFEQGSYVPITRILTAGSGLSGGGNLGADRTFDVNVDNSSLEINSDSLRVKDLGITTAKIAIANVTAAKLAAGVAVANLGFTPVQQGTGINQSASTIKIGYDALGAAKLRLTIDGTDFGFILHEFGLSSYAGSGLGLSGGFGTSQFIVNVDSNSVEISSDTVRLPGGYKAVQSPDGNQIYSKIVTLAGWNMDTTDFVSVPHGIGAQDKIVSVYAEVGQAGSGFVALNFLNYTTGIMNGGEIGRDNTNVQVGRTQSGFFDSASFNNVTVRLFILYTP